MGGLIDEEMLKQKAEALRQNAYDELRDLRAKLLAAETAKSAVLNQLKKYTRSREEIAAQLLASLEEISVQVVDNTNMFIAYDKDGFQIAVPPQHVEGILEAIRAEFKKHEKFSYIEAAEQHAVTAQESANDWRRKYDELAGRRFPIMNEGYPECPSSIPWFALDRYSRQVQSNHGQSLEELAKRGGLDPTELYFVVQSKKYDNNVPDLVEKGVALVKKFNGLDVEWLKLYEEAIAHHIEKHPECRE